MIFVNPGLCWCWSQLCFKYPFLQKTLVLISSTCCQSGVAAEHCSIVIFNASVVIQFRFAWSNVTYVRST